MPQKELERLQAVHRFLKLEVSKEKELQDIVKLAAETCGTPLALITLIDKDTQYIKFKVGTDIAATSRQDAFCNYVIEQTDVMVIPDALLDERFFSNPMVAGGPKVRFYAGSPLTTQDGHNLGSLCVIGPNPKELTASQEQILKLLSRQVIHLLELDASLGILKEQFIQAKTSEIKLRSFFESSSSCYLLIDKEMRVMDFNHALADFLEKTHHVTITNGTNVSEFISPSYLKDFIANYQLALTGKSIHAEQQISYHYGDIIWYITFEPARNSDSEIIGVSYNATDITKRIEQERKVILQNESLRNIAYIQSHELRRPVASIIGLMNVLKIKGYGENEEVLALMEMAVLELDEKIRLVVNYTS